MWQKWHWMTSESCFQRQCRFCFAPWLALSVSDSLFLGRLAPISRQCGKHHVGAPEVALAKAPADSQQHLTGEGPGFQVFPASSLPAPPADV